MLKRWLQRGLARYSFELRRRPALLEGVLPVGRDAFIDQARLFSAVDAAVIFDVGAHHGHITGKYLELFPHAVVHAFEPFPESYAVMRERFAGATSVVLVDKAVAASDGCAEFFVNRAEYTNSLLASDHEATPWVPSSTTENLARIEVCTCTLDSYCVDNNIERIDILKTDIQGAEILALRGARRLLAEKRIDILFLEVLFAPLYAGQSDFCEILAFLSHTGYHLVGIYNQMHGNNGLAGWADAVFVSEDFSMPSMFRENHQLTSGPCG